MVILLTCLEKRIDLINILSQQCPSSSQSKGNVQDRMLITLNLFCQ